MDTTTMNLDDMVDALGPVQVVRRGVAYWALAPGVAGRGLSFAEAVRDALDMKVLAET